MPSAFDCFDTPSGFDCKNRIDAFDVYGPFDATPFTGTGQFRGCIEARGSGYSSLVVTFTYTGELTAAAGYFGFRTGATTPKLRCYRHFLKFHVPTGTISSARLLCTVIYNNTESAWDIDLHKTSDWGTFDSGDWAFENSGKLGSGTLYSSGGTQYINIPMDTSLISSASTIFMGLVNRRDYTDGTFDGVNQYIQLLAAYPILLFNE